MRSIVFIGTGLLLLGGIYGFVDYRKVRNDSKFKSLYESKSRPMGTTALALEPDATSDGLTLPEAVKSTETNKLNSSAVIAREAKLPRKSNKEIDSKLFSRAALEEAIEVPKVKAIKEK